MEHHPSKPESAISWPEPDSERAGQLREALSSWGLQCDRLALVDQALTHSSYAFENGLQGDNERLEFLGDSVIGFIVVSWLYEQQPDEEEGELSKSKAALVSRSVLGRQAKLMGLGPLLRLGKGDAQSGNRRRSSVLGSALEALVGAVFLELGSGKTRDFTLQHIVLPSVALAREAAARDYKSQLQEAVQRRYRETPEYRTVSATGPDHNKQFDVEVFIQGRSYGRGTGSRKKSAENAAAQTALDQFEKEPPAE